MTDPGPVVNAPPGRDAEVDRLTEAIDDLADGRGGVVLLSGEGGVGKTTLSAWASETARARDMVVLEAPCFELSIDTPYACLVSALGPVLRSERGIDGTAVVTGLSSLELLFDGLDTGGSARPTGGDDDLARSRLHGALVTLVSRLSDHGPVVLVVDDLHWADTASIEVLHALTSDLPHVALLVIATLRPFEASERAETRRLLRSLRSADWAADVSVAGLDVDALRELVARRLGSVFPTRVVELVHERSGGTPLVAEELLETMIETGALRPVGRRWELRLDDDVPLPAVADDLIGDRLSRLDPDALELVAIVAVGGEPVTTELIGAVAHRETGSVGAALESLRRAALVDRVELVGRTAWVVHHPIIGAVAVSLVGPEARARFHAAYAEELVGADVDRRGRHLLGAGPLARDPAQVADLTAAGASALDRGAPSEACRMLGAALDAVDDGADVGTELTVNVLRLLGNAWRRRGEFEVAGHHLRRALDLARGVGDLEAEAVVVLDLHEAHWMSTTTPLDLDAAASLLDRLEAAGSKATAFRVVRSQLMDRLRAGDPSSLDEVMAAMTRIIDGLDDAEADLWSRYLDTLEPFLQFRDGQELRSQLRRLLPKAVAFPELHRRVLHELLDLELLLGDRDDVAAAIEAERAFAESLGDVLTWRIGLASWDLAMGDGDLGRTSEVEDVMRIVTRARPAGYLVAIDVLTGVVAGREPPPPDIERPADDPVLEQILAFADLWRTGPARASAARDVLDRWDRWWLMAGMPVTAPVAAGLACIELDDAERLDEVIEMMERFDAGTGRTSAWARVLRGETTTGVERAEHYADAATRFDSLGRPFDAAVCWLQAAEAGGVVTADRLDTARSLFEHAPAPWMLERLEAVAGSTVVSSRPDPRLDDLGLTPREREVAEVVAEGLSNREVANRLFISVRTVTSHLDHIYTKLGIGSRKELTDLLAGPPTT